MKKFSKSCLGLAIAATLSCSATGAWALAEGAGPNGTMLTAEIGDVGLNSGAIGDLSNGSADVDVWQFELTAGTTFSVDLDDGAGTNFGENTTSGFTNFRPGMVLMSTVTAHHPTVIFSLDSVTPADSAGALTSTVGIDFTPFESGTFWLFITGVNNEPKDFNDLQTMYANLTTAGLPSAAFGFDSNVAGNFPGQAQFSFDYNLTVSGNIAPPAVVPVPAAAWLLGSGLIGLAGIARRKKA